MGKAVRLLVRVEPTLHSGTRPHDHIRAPKRAAKGSTVSNDNGLYPSTYVLLLLLIYGVGAQICIIMKGHIETPAVRRRGFKLTY